MRGSSDLQQKGWDRVSLAENVPAQAALHPCTAHLPRRTKGNAAPDSKPAKSYGLAHPLLKFTLKIFLLSSKESIMPKPCKSSHGSDVGKREITEVFGVLLGFVSDSSHGTQLSFRACTAADEQVRCFALPCPGEIVQPSTSPGPCQGCRRGWRQHLLPGWKAARNTKAFPPSSPSVRSINASDGAEE